MDALQRALVDSDRSYRAAKASSGVLSNELLARGPQRGIVQRSDFSHAREQLGCFRGWVFSCVRAISQVIAGQEIKVGRRRRPGNVRMPGNVSELETHALLELLKDPNDLQTSWSLLFVTVASLELTGRALWWLANENGRDMIFHIPTSWIVDIAGSSKRETFFLRPPGHAGEPIQLDDSETCYFHYPHPGDPHGACSPLQAAAMAVMADESIQHSQHASFSQGINPRHALRLGPQRGVDGKPTGMRPRLTGEQRGQLIEAVRNVYQGVHKHGEPLILDGLIDEVITLSLKPSEMDWLNSSKNQKERILQAFGVNEVILGQVEGANRASSLAAESHFIQFTIAPKVQLLSQTLTENLAQKVEPSLVLWLETPVANDEEHQLKQMELLARFGSLTHNELRRWAGLEEVANVMHGWDEPVGQFRGESVGEAIRSMVEQNVQAAASHHFSYAAH